MAQAEDSSGGRRLGGIFGFESVVASRAIGSGKQRPVTIMTAVLGSWPGPAEGFSAVRRLAAAAGDYWKCAHCAVVSFL